MGLCALPPRPVVRTQRVGIPPCVPSQGRVQSTRRFQVRMAISKSHVEDNLSCEHILRVTSFNILAPVYKLRSDRTYESSCRDAYMSRNHDILQAIKNMPSDVFCLQEFWCLNSEMVELYKSSLGADGYDMYMTPRTNGKGDGLATFVKRSEFDVVDMHSIHFNDCADRVSQLTHIASTSDPAKQAIMVNTHLLFPYNSNSTIIQLRETMKVLEFLKAYVASKNIRQGIPILICGDFNGSKSGEVAQFLESQGFVSSYDQTVSPAHLQFQNSSKPDSEEATWVSHIHRDGTCLGVDFLWLLNPSVQMVLPPAADWKAAIFAMIMALIYEDLGLQTTKSGFTFFGTHQPAELECQWPMVERDNTITREAFGRAIESLGLTGEGSIGLLECEIDQCYTSMDADGNAVIDYNEFVSKLDIDSFGQAYEKIRKAKQIEEWKEWEYDRLVTVGATAAKADSWVASSADGCTAGLSQTTPSMGTSFAGCNCAVQSTYELQVVAAELKAEMAGGEWAEDFHLSDHAPVSCSFCFVTRD
mmetsp:Transcript_13195/g.25205  ORF Transcript_13195/g.25205 Transcript_13195/m.25205 type:complete len:531 (+) Transcript_13195:157-1749(+)